MSDWDDEDCPGLPRGQRRLVVGWLVLPTAAPLFLLLVADWLTK